MSSWIAHVKDFQKRNGCSYKEAMCDPDCKESYHATKSGDGLGLKKGFKNMSKSVNKSVKKGIDYLEDTENRHYGRNINNYIQTGNKVVQALKPVAKYVPGGAQVVALSGLQAKVSNEVYNRTRKPPRAMLDVEKQGGGIAPIDSQGFKTQDYAHFVRNRRESEIRGRGIISNGQQGRGIKPNGDMKYYIR